MVEGARALPKFPLVHARGHHGTALHLEAAHQLIIGVPRVAQADPPASVGLPGGAAGDGSSVGRITAASSAASGMLDSSVAGAKNAARGARGAVAGGAGRARDAAGSLLSRARRADRKPPVLEIPDAADESDETGDVSVEQ